MNDQHSQKDQLKLLLVGPLPPPTGGTRVLFQNLLASIAHRPGIGVTVVETRPVRSQKIKAVFDLMGQMARIFRAVGKADAISLHTTISSLPIRGMLIRMVAALYKKPFLVHTFGGTLYRQRYGKIRAGLIRKTLLSASIYLAESKAQVEHAREDGAKRVEWFPNMRPLPAIDEKNIAVDRPCRRFIFLSHVKQTKGIPELIAAGERFGDDVTVDVYGPFRDGMTEATFSSCRRVRYQGVVAPEKVLEVLGSYDALVLPTYYEGEGYPGVIIEAYMVGVPVICTRWRRLPEIVDNRSGLLIEPQNTEALYLAMKKLTDDSVLFKQLRLGAFNKRNEFDIEAWTDRFLGFCREAVEENQKRINTTARRD